MPDSLQGPARQAVLLHERTHIRRRDPLVKPLFYAVVCLHWFNPLAWLALRAFEHDMEAACDEAAVQGCTLAERSTYCESLLQFAMQGRPIRTPGSLAFGQGSVKERIVHLLHYRRLGAGALALCAVDLGGRPYFVYDASFAGQSCGGMDTQMAREFFYAVSYSAMMNLHLKVLYGENDHHKLEAMFKAFAKALDAATRKDARIDGVLSTKGTL